MAYHGINIRTFFLAYNLTFYLTFFLAYNLTFFLAFYSTFFPASFLAFYLASIPAFYLASILAFIFPGMCSGPGVAQCIRSSRYGLDPLMWRRAGRGENEKEKKEGRRKKKKKKKKKKRRRGRGEEEERPSPDRWGFHKHKLWQRFGYTLQCRQTWLENPRTRLAYKWETSCSKWRVVHCHGNGGKETYGLNLGVLQVRETS